MAYLCTVEVVLKRERLMKMTALHRFEKAVKPKYTRLSVDLNDLGGC
jgi:hypothetical protein